MKPKFAISVAGVVVLMLAGTAQAEIPDGVVKVGVLTDLSGIYADLSGRGAIVATQMAIDDFVAQENPPFKVELVSADHQNNEEIAANTARDWFDRDHVSVVSDLVTTTTALAVMKVGKEKNRVILVSGAGSTRITNEDCNDVTVHWTYDTYALSHGTARTLVQRGGKSWFFLTADYAFGVSLQKDASDVVLAEGGAVVGSVRHPFPGRDFSSFLLKAQASGAQVIGLANAGADTVNSIRQAVEFGITPKQTLAGLLMSITDIHALGLKTAQGMYLTEGFYWDMNDETRAWSRRFFEKHQRMPTMSQAGDYSSVMHYLKAVRAVDSVDAQKVMAQMKKTPVNDFFAKDGRIREDGRMVHDMYLFQVKKPSDSFGPWDYYKVVATIPAGEAFQPLSASRCPLIVK
ncbi:MAG TPA: ABC transporter substrate-binding protein [Burkholderiaceae bacterium]|nr:ABC transporter substrate-binding protein [Burkholderiaceae bacterium]